MVQSVRTPYALSFLLLASIACALAGCTFQGDARASDEAASVARSRLQAAPAGDPLSLQARGERPWVCPEEPLEPRYEPTLFVATDGSDSNDGRSEDRPLRTLQAAAESVAPGDVVWVREGSYSSDVVLRRSGEADAPIVFESYPGECAILDGSGLDTYDRVQFIAVDHVVFRNFRIRNSPSQGIYMEDSNENVVTNIETFDNALNGLISFRGDGNVFRYIIAHDNFDPPRGQDADGISVSSGDGNRVSDCVTYRNSDDGLDTWLSTGTVVERCISFSNGYQADGDGNGFKAGGEGRTVNTIVRESIAFGNRANGFDDNSGLGVTFEHNTSFANGHAGFLTTEARVRNNLAFGNEGPAWMGDEQTNELTTNSWSVGADASPFLSTDPTSREFLSLRPDSWAVDVGTDLGSDRSDAAPDLGALPAGETLASRFGVILGSGAGSTAPSPLLARHEDVGVAGSGDGSELASALAARSGGSGPGATEGRP